MTALLPWLVVAMTAVTDVLMPLNVVTWAGYLLAIVLSTFQGNRNTVLAVTGTAGLLTLLAMFVSPAAIAEALPINRILGIFLLFVCGVLCVRLSRLLDERQSAAHRLEELNDTLEKWVGERTDALRHSEERFRLAVEAAPSAMIMVNPEGKINLANAEAERVFGYGREELLGQPIEMLVPARFRAGHPPHRANFLGKPETRRMGAGRDLFGLRKDGSEFPVEIGLNPIVTDEGAFVLSAIVDITERKTAEEKMRFYAEELQGRNQELVRSNQELDEFAYVASHDLKEPLRGIHNFSQFLIEDYHDKLDADGQQKLNTLIKLSTRLETLIDSLHQYSRVGRVELALVPTSLQKLVEEIIDSLRFTIDEVGVEVRIPKHLPTVLCDHVRVGEVFRNLITNAIKYNESAQKWIEISFLPERPLVFYVRDNGIGIRERHRDAIFRMFKRLHGRDQFGGGTGVGLTIVKKIVERHGGRVWFESTYGEGSTFYFTLPSDGSSNHGA